MSQPHPPYGQPQGQAQFQPQGPPQNGSQGQLVVHMRKPLGWGSASMISPSIVIDNFPAASQWETNVFTVPAGTRQVRCEARYMWAYGQAGTNVDVAPGQTVELFYSSPLVSFGAGALGFNPQDRPGKIVFGLLLAIPLAILLLIIIGAATAAIVGG